MKKQDKIKKLERDIEKEIRVYGIRDYERRTCLLKLSKYNEEYFKLTKRVYEPKER